VLYQPCLDADHKHPFAELPLHHFGVVLADPPLKFKVRSPKGEGRSACRHYSVMSFNEIVALPVFDIAADDCWLFLWMPNPFVPRVDELMTSWGFRFSGPAFVWVKMNKSGTGFFTGLGYTTRKNVEICWLGRRGSPRRNAKDVRELICGTAPRAQPQTRSAVRENRAAFRWPLHRAVRAPAVVGLELVG
jgi:N6-adenosine-specific RNA methylase IME4